MEKPRDMLYFPHASGKRKTNTGLNGPALSGF